MVERPTEEVSQEELKRALKKMRSGKVLGPTRMPIDLMKRADITVFSGIVDEREFLEDWKNSVIVPIHKGKGNALERRNIEELNYWNRV